MSEKLKRIESVDGSVTFFNNEFGDTYHSVTVSALDEARVKYIEPAEIKDGFKVLDFCFGLGYNSLAVLNNNTNIQITGIEIDRDILEEIKNINVPLESKDNYGLIQKSVLDALNNRENTNLKLIIGDGSKITKTFEDNSFNTVLFDPFSPSKHPELWSLDVFKEMFRIIKSSGRLTTYSCARWVRDNMREAGFEVIDGPKFGRRSASTIAIRH